MLTVAITALVAGIFAVMLWPSAKPALVCLGIGVISLIFKFLP